MAKLSDDVNLILGNNWLVQHKARLDFVGMLNHVLFVTFAFATSNLIMIHTTP